MIKDRKQFFSSNYSIIIPLFVLKTCSFTLSFVDTTRFEDFVQKSLYQLFSGSVVDDEVFCIGINIFTFLISYCLIGVFVYPKIKDKKKSLLVTVAFEICLTFLTSFIFLKIVPLFLYNIWVTNPVTTLLRNYLDFSALGCIITIVLSPTSVGFVYLFSKTPLLFQFLKRIRIKKSGKSITFYLKDVETKQ